MSMFNVQPSVHSLRFVIIKSHQTCIVSTTYHHYNSSSRICSFFYRHYMYVAASIRICYDKILISLFVSKQQTTATCANKKRRSHIPLKLLYKERNYYLWMQQTHSASLTIPTFPTSNIEHSTMEQYTKSLPAEKYFMETVNCMNPIPLDLDQLSSITQARALCFVFRMWRIFADASN